MANFSSLFALTILALAYGFPLETSDTAQESGKAERSAPEAPSDVNSQQADAEWNAAVFASLDRQLRSEDLVPLSRRMREILNYASRIDGSAIDQDSSIRVSNGETSDEQKDKETLAFLYVDPVATTTATLPSDSESLDDGEAAATRLRVKKSFYYYPARG